jgi:hypothetical protein
MMATGKYDHWVMGEGLPPGHPDLLPEDYQEPVDPRDVPTTETLNLFTAAMRILYADLFARVEGRRGTNHAP